MIRSNSIRLFDPNLIPHVFVYEAINNAHKQTIQLFWQHASIGHVVMPHGTSTRATAIWYKSIQQFQRYGFRQVWPKCCLIWQVFGPWASPHGENGQITMMLHNYRCRQVHETLNGVNPSSGFRDMRSTKSGPNLWQIWQVFGPWASPYWANGQMTMTVHNYRPRKFHRTSNGENPSSSYRDMGSTSLAAARPAAHLDHDNNAPPVRRTEG